MEIRHAARRHRQPVDVAAGPDLRPGVPDTSAQRDPAPDPRVEGRDPAGGSESAAPAVRRQQQQQQHDGVVDVADGRQRVPRPATGQLADLVEGVRRRRRHVDDGERRLSGLPVRQDAAARQPEEAEAAAAERAPRDLEEGGEAELGAVRVPEDVGAVRGVHGTDGPDAPEGPDGRAQQGGEDSVGGSGVPSGVLDARR